jgi:uncharacterized membrane protein YoaT (DUF817 family)
MNRKICASSGILLLTILATFFLAQYQILLSILILLIAYIKHRLYPIKKELTWFTLVTVSGAITEVLLVNSGSVWTYSISQFYGIPVWIPLFWGTIATTIVVIYNGLVDR